MRIDELPTPALLVERTVFEANVAAMSAALPGARLRPHVKAFKCTELARVLADAGHLGFCAATIREVEGMAAAGLGEDLLLANEVLDARRLVALVQAGTARVTVAVDSDETVAAAADGGVTEVLVDVCVGMPRCGCEPDDAERIADLARRRGLEVRGVMGYEGHLMMDPEDVKAERVEAAMALLLAAHDRVGGDLISGGGTGTYRHNRWATEIQAGSYTLMDTEYAGLDVPFRPALTVLGTVISVHGSQWAVADVGLKSLGMDHGNPAIDGARVWFVSDEHVTFSGLDVRVGERVRVVPGHVDPTVARHELLNLVDGDDVVERWPIDLRFW